MRILDCSLLVRLDLIQCEKYAGSDDILIILLLMMESDFRLFGLQQSQAMEILYQSLPLLGSAGHWAGAGPGERWRKGRQILDWQSVGRLVCGNHGQFMSVCIVVNGIKRMRLQ